MATMEGLFTEVVAIVIQRLSKALGPMMEDAFQFGPLNFVQETLTPSRRSAGPVNCCYASAPFMWPKSKKSEGAKSGL
jgi:hypothetical protein